MQNKIKILYASALIILLIPFQVFALNDVQITASFVFELKTSDTIVDTTINTTATGQVTNFNVNLNYIDITLDNASEVTFNTAVGGQYIKITKQSGSNDYTVNPTCPTTSATLRGNGAQVVLRLEVLTTNLCPNFAPVASSVNITGLTNIGAILTGHYTYSDADGDSEGISTFKWLRNGSIITGATSTSYMTTQSDSGAIIKFEVTPVALTGTSPGTSVQSSGLQLSSSGGGSGSVPSSSVGSGQSNYYIEMFKQIALGQITENGTNILGYAGSSFVFDVVVSKNLEISRHQVVFANLDMLKNVLRINVFSTPQVFELLIGEEKNIDLDNDGIHDVSVKYNNLLVNRVDLTVKQLVFDESGSIIKQLSFEEKDSSTTTDSKKYCDLFTRDLKTGMIGEDVKELQKYLNKNGFVLANSGPGSKGNETTTFGALTREALKKFQRTNDLNITGIFDLKTREYLGCTTNNVSQKETATSKYIFTRNLSTGTIGEDVKELQKYLNDNGFVLANSGPGSKGNETTKFGALTREALKKFQKNNKITPANGYFGSVTKDFINNQN